MDQLGSQGWQGGTGAGAGQEGSVQQCLCGPGDTFGVALVALLCFPTPLGASRPLHCWERLWSTRCSLGLFHQQGTARIFGLVWTWHRSNFTFCTAGFDPKLGRRAVFKAELSGSIECVTSPSLGCTWILWVVNSTLGGSLCAWLCHCCHTACACHSDLCVCSVSSCLRGIRFGADKK